MKVNQAIIHEIIKKDGEMHKGNFDLSDAVIELLPKVREMFSELDGRYSNLGQSLGTFSEGTGSFPSFFKNYISDRTEERFIEFSHLATTHLLPYIDKEVNAKGGHLIFVEYEKTTEFIGIFFVRHKLGGSISKDKKKSSYVINDSIYIDIDKLAMAARVNIKEFLNTTNQKRYVSFINKSSIDSKYFTSWICATELRQDREDTKLLRQILLSVPTPLDETNSHIDPFEFLNRVHSFIKLIPKGENIDLFQIGLVFYDDKDILIKYAEENQISINHNFKPDNSILRQFVKVKVKADEISIDFPLTHMDDKKIKVIGDQTIITSDKLAQLIKKEQIRRQNGIEYNT